MNLIERRRQMMMSKSLPYDAEIEYLESTGTQYIITTFVPNQDNLKIITRVYKKNAPGDNFVYHLYTTNPKGFNMDWYAGSMYIRNLGVEVINGCADGTHTFEVSGTQYIQDGVARTCVRTETLTDNTRNLTIFAVTSGAYGLKGRIYYFQCYYGDELVFDLIPVRVGQVGYMYDKVSGQLFGNQGTGNFVLGPDKN